MFFDLVHRTVMDDRSMCRSIVKAITDFKALDFLRERRGEFVVDALLDVYPVRTDAGLSR
jgi:hypothetical protein